MHCWKTSYENFGKCYFITQTIVGLERENISPRHFSPATVKIQDYMSQGLHFTTSELMQYAE